MLVFVVSGLQIRPHENYEGFSNMNHNLKKLLCKETHFSNQLTYLNFSTGILQIF